jgi:hypothetical protein
MSHFIVNMILPTGEVNKRKIEELLSPYDEEIQTEPYIAYYMRDAEKLHKEELRYYKEILDRKDGGFNVEKIAEHYKYLQEISAGQYYDKHFEGRTRDKKGNILSTYNPKSKWDWWQIGGRFAGWLLNLPEKKSSNNLQDNCCPIEQVIIEKKIPFALILPDGKWLEQGKMGWWAIVTNEMPENAWEKLVISRYKRYPRHMVVQIDCHI